MNKKNPFFKLYPYLIKTNVILGNNSVKFKKSWHPNLSQFLVGTRNKTVIFNYKLILQCLIKFFFIFTKIIKADGNILIVNNNQELSKILYYIKKNTHSCNLFFSDCGYTKGSLTNFNVIYKKIKTFSYFYENFDNFLKENNIHFSNYKKMKKNYKGFLIKKKLNANKFKNSNKFNTQNNMVLFNKTNSFVSWKPDLVILFGVDNMDSIIKECLNLHIPTMKFIDSNMDPLNITYPIFINTHNYDFLWFFSNLLVKLTNKYCN